MTEKRTPGLTPGENEIGCGVTEWLCLMNGVVVFSGDLLFKYRYVITRREVDRLDTVVATGTVTAHLQLRVITGIPEQSRRILPGDSYPESGFVVIGSGDDLHTGWHAVICPARGHIKNRAPA